MANTKRIDSTLPAATITQRLAVMSDVQLAQLAETLSKCPDADAALTMILECLEVRIAPDTFAAFLGKIFGEAVAS